MEPTTEMDRIPLDELLEGALLGAELLASVRCLPLDAPSPETEVPGPGWVAASSG